MQTIDINQAKEQRQAHLQLNTPCIERGGNSTNHKGVLAQFLDTNIPSGRILLCHACNNGLCSNALHLYWGTDRENLEDARLFGTYASVWERTVKKYGLEKARSLNRRPNEVSSRGGKVGIGKPKSEAHKKALSESYKKRLVLQQVEGADLKSVQC